jgi:hypothetical protein
VDPVSQFKFACPICGQHLQARSEEAGHTTECPTCFKKLTVPQAPANGGGNLIIAAALAESSRRVAVPPSSPQTPVGAPKGGSRGLRIILIVTFLAVLAVIAGLVFLWPGAAVDSPSDGGMVQRWTTRFDELQLLETPVVGRLNGWSFEANRQIWRGTQLILRQEGGSPAGLRLELTFPLAGGELVPGKTWKLRTKDPPLTAPVRMLWKDERGDNQSLVFPSDYLLWVRFDAVSKKKVTGRIHLCLSDPEHSWVAGRFEADVKTVVK